MSAKNTRGKNKENRSKKHRADRKRSKEQVHECTISKDFEPLSDLPERSNNREQ